MMVRVRLDITGVVQGVGFRPAVARIAAEFGLGGFVYNDAGSVHCEWEGPAEDVDAAIAALRQRGPRMARIDTLRSERVEPNGDNTFEIVGSRCGDDSRTLIPPDIAVCDDCLADMRDPANRRYGHPFITCTNCGPRYTVITDLPYDRPMTTMADFPMCPACAAEYHDPLDRRYHAQTIACPECGPRLRWQADGMAGTKDPIDAAVRALRNGLIVAVKGIGGFHLACRADDASAVRELRRRKSRPAKPFAVMVADVRAAGDIAALDEAAAAALTSSSAPIVLVARRGSGIAEEVAPRLTDLGVMLAYSPVHHLLFDRLGSVPLVMTSANRGGSPIVFRDDDLDWIDGLADAVLTHDRPIHVPCEDSVITIDDRGAPLPLRRSRGYAPLPVSVTGPLPDRVILATGGDLKTTFCLVGADGHAHMSSHLGDMADPRTQKCFEGALEHLAFMTDRTPDVIACDMHPGYATTSWARRYALGRPVVAVQHHHAHAVSLLAEHGRLGTPVIAVTYDGTGYGTDGTIWGGELLAISDTARFTRVGHLRTFALPGGDGAVRHPARIALDLLHRAGIDWAPDLPPVAALDENALHILGQQIPRGFGCVPTTSMGRLFDAVASLLGVCQEVSYEGQAAVELEHVARRGTPSALDFSVADGVLDPAPVIRGIVEGLRNGTPVADLAAGFHLAVIRATTVVATECARAAGISAIGLTGGVFANQLLLQGLRLALTESGLEVLSHRIVPCNDGGLALGQAAIVAALVDAESTAGSERNGVCASESPAR
ncbi:hydrogenase maturation protein HypF [Mycolicibacterium sp. BK556]|uniref:carbamoyltransferase HypF n=1 Tax=unclassified Mycolicibacterium TaxID=2636767 RepID=UPI001616F1AC|nr:MULTISPECIES: carbamoyltransferase HypF [unclassified Mycolicibacterium]MBB3606326.1 hydrogenase maturation protein HypF [Mycolicibacterium sp. BK556]MBB3632905.1 hydrogenase maturation protein HypF [Mycolicibacterium sp. BK607]